MKLSWIFVTLLSIAPLRCFAEFDYSTLIGEWASYQVNELSGNSYYYLRIEKDNSGEFGFMWEGSQGKGFSFTSEAVTVNDGMLIIKPIVKDQPKFVAAVSASVGMLNGSIFMYQSFDSEVWQLFNTLQLRLFPLKQKVLDLAPEINEHRTNK